MTNVERLINQCDQMTALVREIYQAGGMSASHFLQLCRKHQLMPGPILSGRDWYHYTPDQVLAMLLRGDLTEGLAAYYLGLDRLEVRRRMEEKYGTYWRDKQLPPGF